MKPDFALDLSQDELTLLYRVEDGWAALGSTRFDAPDLTDRLAVLRAEAEARAPGAVCTKLILPESQILYTEVDAPGPDDASRRKQIEAALDGRTPYSVEELAYDWWQSEGGLRVAVVARVTLAEAEEFAEEHGFGPVSFVGTPDTETSACEPFFGLTARAAAHLPKGARLERDDNPVRIVDLPTEPSAPVEPAETEPASEPAGESVDIELQISDISSEALPAEAEAAPESAGDEGPVITPDVVDAEGNETEDDTGEAPFIAVDDGDAIDEQFSEEAGLARKPAFSSRRQIDELEGERLQPAGARGRLHLGGAPTEVPPGPVRPVTIDADIRITAPELAVPATGSRSGEDAANAGDRRPRSFGRTILSALPETRHGTQAQQRERRTNGGGDAEGNARHGMFSGRPGLTRSDAASRARLGLLLATLLILLMAGVVLWSMMSADTPETQSAAPATTQTAAVTPAPDTASTDIGPAPALPAAPEVAAPEAPAPAASPDSAPTDIATAAPEPTAPADPAPVPTAPATPVEGAVIEVLIPDTAAVDPVSPAPADEPAPAAPGPATLWTAAPSVGAGPEPETSGAATLSAAGAAAPSLPDLRGALPGPASTATDPLPGWQPAPPPFGTVFNYGPDGNIVPTPEGVITPEGFALYAGPPPVVPAAAPRPGAALPAPTSEAPATETAATDAEIAPEALPAPVDPAHAAKKPRPRPATAADQDAATAEPSEGAEPLVAVATGPLPPPVDPAHAARQPKTRPESVIKRAEAARAEAEAAEAAARAAAEALANASNYAVASSQRPSERPSNLAKAVEAAVAAAVAATLEPAAPPQPEPAPQAVTAKAPDPVEIDEPEPATGLPDIPTTVTVAKQATIKNAIDLGEINLIGVYGSSSNRRALIRMPSGRLVKVKIGDRLDGGQVAAIGDSELTYVKGGRTYTLKIPKNG